MTRPITTHQTDDLNKRVIVEAWDDVSPGIANKSYRLSVNNQDFNQEICKIRFQSKPVSSPVDVDGVTNESLLAILIDRLRSHQEGVCSCRENACALTHLEEALFWLQARMRDREARGVVEKNVK